MSVKRVQVSYLTLSRSLSPYVRIALLAERKRPCAERLHAPLSVFRSA